MEKQQSVGDGREEEIKDSEGVEKVLIERDGKFELVNASDMAAVGGGSQADERAGGGAREEELNRSLDNPGVELADPRNNQTSAPVAVSEGIAGDGDQPTPNGPTLSAHDTSNDPAAPMHRAPQHDTPVNQKSVDPTSVTDACSDSPEPLQDTSSHYSEIDSSSDSPEPWQDLPSPATDAKSASEPPELPQADASDVKKSERSCQGVQSETRGVIKPASKPHELKSGSRVQIVVADHIPARTNKTLSSASTANLGWSSSAARRQQALVNRAVSAPGVRARGKSEEDEEARMRRERNEVAFAAWLARKNSELMERRNSEKGKHQTSEEELKLKRERSEAAYQAWLSSKKGFKSQEKLSTPTASVMPVSEEKSSAAFVSWVSRKQRQRQLEKELEQKRNAEQEEAAGKVAPDLVEQAYKE